MEVKEGEKSHGVAGQSQSGALISGKVYVGSHRRGQKRDQFSTSTRFARLWSLESVLGGTYPVVSCPVYGTTPDSRGTLSFLILSMRMTTLRCSPVTSYAPESAECLDKWIFIIFFKRVGCIIKDGRCMVTGKERKITKKSGIRNINGIEICVCVLDGELWIRSDEWVIRGVDGLIVCSCQF